jgi:hypothetical protein
VVDLTTWGHLGGFNQVTLVLMVDLTMCPFKVFQRLKVCFENDRINLALCKSAKSSTSQISCRNSSLSKIKSLFFHKSHQIYVICQYIIVLTPIYGAAYSNVQVLLMRSKLIGSQVYIPT